MKPRPIGIVGGAGPLAGAQLLDRVLKGCMEKYSCYKDADFPEIMLISFPFTDMLSSKIDNQQIRQELQQVITKLRFNGCEIIAIACNTLHVFLENKEEKQGDFIHLLEETAKVLNDRTIPLVLCTSTSAKEKIHQRFFPCTYLMNEKQLLLDEIIENILQGKDKTQALSDLINEQKEEQIILGCTELSLFTKAVSLTHKTLIDPLEIVAEKIIEKSFTEGKKP